MSGIDTFEHIDDIGKPLRIKPRVAVIDISEVRGDLRI